MLQRDRLLRLVWPALLVGLAACGGGDPGTTEPAPSTDASLTDATAYSSDADASLASATESAAITHHQATIDGRAIAYTAVAGHLTAVREGTGAPQASFFYVAYTADGADRASRPVTFFYNGGPGSATLWLHLGSFGPKRLATGMPSNRLASSFPVVDNAESLLDVSDLVFVDAVGTGLSQAIAPSTNRSFWGVDADARVFRDFIARYLAVNGRQASPRVIFGESYGTLRSAALAEELEASGVGVDGVVLLSSVLDYNSNCAVAGPAQGDCSAYLPSYAATGAYFNLIQPPPPDLGAHLQQAVSFADERYGPAVRATLGTGQAPDLSLVPELSRLTGEPEALWQSSFSLWPDRYRVQAVPGTMLGRYDARIADALDGPLAVDGDPSLTVIQRPFVAAARDHLAQALQYRSRARYVDFSNAIDLWDWSHDGKPLPDAVPDLAAAMLLNPALRVLSLNGHHDLATPYHQTRRDLERLGPRRTLTYHHVAGGHMTYLDDGARREQRSALLAFYRSLRTAP